MFVKEKLTLTVEEKLKKRARELANETRLSISEIFELLINGTSEKEILKLRAKNLK